MKPYVMQFQNTLSILIAGIPGSGKSYALEQLLLNQCEVESPDQLKVVMIDFKALMGIQFIDLPHLAMPVVFEPEEATRGIQEALNIIHQRKADVIAHKARKKDWFRVLVVIDEITEVAEDCGKKVLKNLASIARLGRAFNVVTLAATQYPTAKSLGNQFINTMPSRMCFHQNNNKAYSTVLGEIPNRTLEQHESCCLMNGYKGQMFLQFEAKESNEKRINRLANKYGKTNYIFRDDSSNMEAALPKKLQKHFEILLPHFNEKGKLPHARMKEILIDEMGKSTHAKNLNIIQDAIQLTQNT